jgi:transposase
MTSSCDIRVSIDVGCRRHAVAVGLPNGQVLEEFELEHRPEGFDRFFERIERHRRHFGGEVSVAMEGYNGWARPLDTLVRSRGYRLFNINNLKLARFKEIFPAAAKNDRIDARKGLELFQLHAHLPAARRVLEEVVGAPAVNDQLKRLTRRRRALVDEKTRVLSRLQCDLQAVCPGLLAITRDAENRWFLNFLTHGDDLTKLAGLRPKTVLDIPAVGRRYAAFIRAWQKQAHFSHEVDYAGPMIIEDAHRVLELRGKIKAIESQCQALLERSEIAALVDSIPGFALVCSTELAGELGTVERFGSEASLAVYIGMANLDDSSGRHRGAKSPKHVNTHAKAAMMTGVDRHRKLIPQSQRYYEKKRHEGKTHNQAIRALGRHLCRVLFRMLKQKRTYEIREPEATPMKEVA